VTALSRNITSNKDNKLIQILSNSNNHSKLGGSVAECLACWTQAQKAWVQNAVMTLSGNSLRQTVHTQAVKLVAALLRVAGITACLAESNGSLPLGHVTCRLTAKNQDQLQNPMLGNRIWASFLF